MSDNISRADAIEAVRSAIRKEWLLREAIVTDIEALPSADAVHGEWIFNPTDAIDLMFAKPKCSKCGFESSDGGNFCPNCGARMKGGDAEVRNDRTYINEPYMQQSRHDDGRMTREEAKARLEANRGAFVFKETNEALDMAIEALQAVPNCQKCAIKELWEETEKEDLVSVVRCNDCRHANECHKSVQYTRNEPRTVTMGYSPIKWCSRGERKEDE